MANLVARSDGGELALWQLDLLECPRAGVARLRAGAQVERQAEAERLACASSIAELAQGGWTDDWFERLPWLVSRGLLAQWPLARFAGADYSLAAARLTELLRRRLLIWRPPQAHGWLALAAAHWRDRSRGLTVSGRLDLLVGKDVSAAGPGLVLDFRLSTEDLQAAQPPLSVVALAILAQARLGLRSTVEVRRVCLISGDERSWWFDRAAAAVEWCRLRRVVGELAPGPPLARPGAQCRTCGRLVCEGWQERALVPA